MIASLALVFCMSQPWGILSGTTRGIVLGEPTTGKSFLAEQLTRAAFRVVWFDVSGDDYNRPGRAVLTVSELERWPVMLDDPHARIVIAPRGDDAASLTAELDRVLSVFGLWQRPPPQRNLVFVCDEVGDYRESAEQTLNALFRRGRHLGIGSLLVSQVATDIPLTCRRLASDVWSLGQAYPKDIDALASTYGEDFADRVRHWRKHRSPDGRITYDPPIHFERSKSLIEEGV